MRYAAPLFEGKEHYIPIVMKNRDCLVGFLAGVHEYYTTMSSIFEELGIGDVLFSPGESEMYSMSSRKYNDIMPDGRRESLLTKKEKKQIFDGVLEEAEGMMESEENDGIVEYSDVLKVSCHCGMGFYSWEDYEDIPSVDVKCDICGRHLIHYTGHDDWEFDYEEGKES